MDAVGSQNGACKTLLAYQRRCSPNLAHFTCCERKLCAFIFLRFGNDQKSIPENTVWACPVCKQRWVWVFEADKGWMWTALHGTLVAERRDSVLGTRDTGRAVVGR
jgi:hypothetical protein